MQKLKRIYRTQIIKILEETSYYDLRKFSFDNKSKRILYDGIEIEPKMEAWEFGKHIDCEVSVKEFQDAIYGFAKVNTPEILVEHYNVADVIHYWLYKKGIDTITTQEVVDGLKQNIPDLTAKKVAQCLTDLCWRKKHTKTGNVWIR